MPLGSRPAWTPLTVVPSASHLSCFPSGVVRGLDRGRVEDLGASQAAPQMCRRSALTSPSLTFPVCKASSSRGSEKHPFTVCKMPSTRPGSIAGGAGWRLSSALSPSQVELALSLGQLSSGVCWGKKAGALKENGARGRPGWGRGRRLGLRRGHSGFRDPGTCRAPRNVPRPGGRQLEAIRPREGEGSGVLPRSFAGNKNTGVGAGSSHSAWKDETLLPGQLLVGTAKAQRQAPGLPRGGDRVTGAVRSPGSPGSRRSRPRIRCPLSLNRLRRRPRGVGPRSLPRGASRAPQAWRREVGDGGGESPSLEPAKVGSPSSRSSQGQCCLLCKAVVKIRDTTWGITEEQYLLKRCELCYRRGSRPVVKSTG